MEIDEEDEFDSLLHDNCMKPARFSKKNFIAGGKTNYDGLVFSRKNNESSTKLRKKMFRKKNLKIKQKSFYSPDTPKRKKQNFHFSSPSEEIKGKISIGELSMGEITKKERLKNILQHDKSDVRFIKEDTYSLTDVNCSQTSFVGHVTKNKNDLSSEKLSIDRNMDDSDSSYETAASDFEFCCEKTCEVKIALKGNFHVDSNRYEKTESDFKFDRERFSKIDSSKLSLDNKNSNIPVDYAPWPAKKCCDQLYIKTKLDPCKSPGKSIIEEKVEKSYNRGYSGKSLKLGTTCHFNFRKQLSSEKKIMSQSLDSTNGKSGDQFHIAVTKKLKNKQFRHSSLAFSSPKLDNVKRLFDVLSPRNRSVPHYRSQLIPFHYKNKIDTTRKTISDQVKSAIQLISILAEKDKSELELSNTRPSFTKLNLRANQAVNCLVDESYTERSEKRLKQKCECSSVASELRDCSPNLISNTKEFCSKSKQIDNCFKSESPTESSTAKLTMKLKSALAESGVTAFPRQISDERKVCPIASEHPVICFKAEFPIEESKVELERKVENLIVQSELTSSAQRQITNKYEICGKSKIASKQPVDCRKEVYRTEQFKAGLQTTLENSPLELNLATPEPREILNSKEKYIEPKLTLNNLEFETRIENSEAGLKRQLKNNSFEVSNVISPTTPFTQISTAKKCTWKHSTGCHEESNGELKRKLKNYLVTPDMMAPASSLVSNTRKVNSKSKLFASEESVNCLEKKSCAEETKSKWKRKLGNSIIKPDLMACVPRRSKIKALLLIKENLSKRPYRKRVK